MENEMIREAAMDAIPAAQDIVEEAAAQAIVQDIPMNPVATKAEPKHSGLKTILLVASLTAIALIKPAKNAWNNHKEKQAAKRRDEFNRLYDERRAQERAEAQAASEAEATDEQIDDFDETTTE